MNPFVKKDYKKAIVAHYHLHKNKFRNYKELKGNWSAESREQLIARIKWAVKQSDPEIINKMFDHLPCLKTYKFLFARFDACYHPTHTLL